MKTGKSISIPIAKELTSFEIRQFGYFEKEIIDDRIMFLLAFNDWRITCRLFDDLTLFRYNFLRIK